MRIDSIGSTPNTNYKQTRTPNFTSLIKESSVQSILDNMSNTDRFEFNQIEQRLSKTKFWDLKLSGIGDRLKEFKFHFINKQNKNEIITDGIYPYDRSENKIRFYSIIYGSENAAFNTVETLEFESEKRAKELMDAYNKNLLYMQNREYHLTPLQNLKMKEVLMDMLEESAPFLKKKNEAGLLNTGYQTKATTGNNFKDEAKNINLI